ncbi:MAG: VanZ family protein [Flavobacteriales bacterium]|nr:VanZ family protein [Flavobacteriales bacterium]
MNKSRIFRIISPSLFVVISLTFLFLLPVDDLEVSSWWGTYKIDKLIHIIAFAILALSISITLTKLRVLIDFNYRLMALIFVVCAIYGIILELLQKELGMGRSAELLDIVADCVGVLFGFVIFRIVYVVFPE